MDVFGYDVAFAATEIPMDDDDIAIVGIGCRLPGAENVAEFWTLLKKGENHVIDIPFSRWDNSKIYDRDPDALGKSYVPKAGFVSNVYTWDPEFFGIGNAEAALVDPQQRMVLTCTHMALEDGGITRKDLAESQTGVYIGVMADDYKKYVLGQIDSAYTLTGVDRSIISARVAYVYNLAGPAMTIETACSSSMVAVDTASQALRMGTITAAICGGVNLMFDPNVFVALTKARMASPSGQCRSFTKDADGYARGEGCGILVLKRLKDAEQDGNRIWATINTAVNQDGRNETPINHPSAKAQTDLMNSMYHRFGIDKTSIQVIEAHGTGTRIGDKTETFALGTVLGHNRQKKTFLGSVKTNIGHLESAAGVAGIIKVLLMMEHGEIVPSLWYNKENENPELKLEKYGFEVPIECIDWPKEHAINRIACVNNFGFGGTNSHAVIKQYERDDGAQQSSYQKSLPYIFVLSALDAETLQTNVRNLNEKISGHSYDLASLSYTTLFKRDLWQERIAVTASSQQELMIALQNKMVNHKENTVTKDKNLVFVFCGDGTVWNGMGKDLLGIPCFNNKVNEIDNQINHLTGWSILQKLQEENQDICDNPMVEHIAIFTYQVALAELWKYYGIVPNRVVGMSVGEVAAAYVSGELDLESASKVIYHRSRVLSQASKGSMAVVMNVPIAELQILTERYSFSIAVFLSPVSCTISGEKEEIKLVECELRKKFAKMKLIPLDVHTGYHSRFVDKAAQELSKVSLNLQGTTRCLPLVSTVTGKTVPKGNMSSIEYWSENISKPVLFQEAVVRAQDIEQTTIFVEIGPSPALYVHICDIFPGQDIKTIISAKPQNEGQTFGNAICSLVESGLNFKWDRIVPSSRMPCTDIPSYQLNKMKNIVPNNNEKLTKHPFISQIDSNEFGAQFKALVDFQNSPFIFEHIVNGKNILPGAFYSEIALEVGTTVLETNKRDISVSLEFLKPVHLTQHEVLDIRISTRQQNNGFRFNVNIRNVAHCRGWVYKQTRRVDSVYADPVALMANLVTKGNTFHKSKTQIYEDFKTVGFEYGPAFQLLQNMITNGNEAVCEIQASQSIIDSCHNNTLGFHSTLIDAMTQSTFMENTLKRQNIELSMPASIGEINIYGSPSRTMTIFSKTINDLALESVHQQHFSICMFDEAGNLIAALDNFTTYRRKNNSHAPCELKYTLEWLFEEKKSKKIMMNCFTETEVSKGKSLMFAGPNLDGELSAVSHINGIIVTEKKDDETLNEYANTILRLNPFTQEGIDIGAIVYFVGYRTLSIESVHDIEKLCTYVTGNLMLLKDLIMSWKTLESALPFFVVTESSQGKIDRHDVGHSLVGNELWGFVRSLNGELDHNQITLIDLQPSLQKTHRILTHFIKQEMENKSELFGGQIIIDQNGIYSAHILRSPSFLPTPVYGKVYHTQLASSQMQKVMWSAQERDEYFLTNTSSTKNQSSRHLNVQSVVVLPPNSTKTLLVRYSKPVVSEEVRQVIGIEFIGTVIDEQKERNNENVQSYICVSLTEANTVVYVKEDFVVKLDDVPYYYPGLLSFILVCYRIAESVKAYSSVTLLWDNPNIREFQILRHVLLNTHPKEVNLNVESADVIIDVNCVSQVRLLTALMSCKKFVSLFKEVPIIARRCTGEGSELEVISITDVFREKNISVNLNKSVRWLKENTKWKALFSLGEEERCQFSLLPFHRIDIANRNNSNIAIRNPLPSLFQKSGMYLITGGLTGLGWEMMQILAEMCAGLLISVSRRKASTEVLAEINTIERRFACRIKCLIGDVCDFSSMVNIFKEVDQHSEGNVRLEGIFHNAGVLDSQLLSNMDETHLDRVLSPKVRGSLILHLLTAQFFWLPGQSNYGAANCFMDTFMNWRRSKGLPGQAINWGALYIGMSADQKIRESFERRGINLMQALDVKSCFKDALLCNRPYVMYADINWDSFSKPFTKIWNPKFIEVVTAEFVTSMHQQAIQPVYDFKALQVSDRQTQKSALEEVVLLCGREVLGVPKHTLSLDVTFHEVGLDSFGSMTLTNTVKTITGCRIPPAVLADHNNSLNDVVCYLLDELFGNST
ncbi:LOW QUALITY PROTEIN: mycolipanoate synthase-like [Mya arenaria]|uniref:LOW QUALITY PROTEIN: mycolipanoate synthase-like n=1 Tax=Mya arenaria TaxID=6604 RepID=UPI0022E8D690|nr:LOW QUALITY PROTEIN: mycolipanoate synthase-like [Mya arenaria]